MRDISMMNELNSKILNYILILFFAFVDCKTYAEEVNSWNELLRKEIYFLVNPANFLSLVY